MLSWTNPAARATDHFSVKDCCYLPSWGVFHIPDSHEQENLIRTCLLLEKVRALVGRPVRVHCMIRPNTANCGPIPTSKVHWSENPGRRKQQEAALVARNYNAFKDGAPQSAHIVGLAVDFDVPGIDCDELRARLEPHLESWGCRMERNPGADWVHLDLAPVIHERYFRP